MPIGIAAALERANRVGAIAPIDAERAGLVGLLALVRPQLRLVERTALVSVALRAERAKSLDGLRLIDLCRLRTAVAIAAALERPALELLAFQLRLVSRAAFDFGPLKRTALELLTA